MRKEIYRTLAWSCLSVLSACQVNDLDKIKPATISPHLALNLGFSEYTVRELLDDLDSESVVEGPNNTLSLHFEDSTVFNDNDELVAVSSVSNVEEFAPGLNVPATPIGYEIDINETYTFSFPANNGEEIDSIFFSTGTLDYEMVSTFDGDIEYTWVIEGTQDVDTDENLTQTRQLTFSSGNVTDSYSRSLLGLKSKFYKNAMDENEFAVRVTGTISFAPGSSVSPTDRMDFDLAFNNPGISKLYGNFGNESIELQQQTISMASFEDFSGDGLKLENPSVLLITDNSYGLDLDLSFDEVRAVGEDGSFLLLTEKGAGIDGLVTSPDTEGQTKKDTVTLNSENSNINELLNSTPVAMDFTVSATPNPAGTLRDPNFLLSESQIKVKSVIIVPMQFQMDGFAVDFDFELDGLDAESAESMTFNIITTNELPFSGTIDLNFQDDQGQTLYSLPNAASIQSPSVGADGRTVEALVTNSGIDLTQEGIDALLNAKRIAAVANIATFEAEADRFVTLYSDYTLKIELSLAGEVTIEL